MAYPTDPIYKLVKDYSFGGSVLRGVLRGTDGTGIPIDEGNRDYQAYLAWVAEGNTAEAAD